MEIKGLKRDKHGKAKMVTLNSDTIYDSLYIFFGVIFASAIVAAGLVFMQIFELETFLYIIGVLISMVGISFSLALILTTFSNKK